MISDEVKVICNGFGGLNEDDVANHSQGIMSSAVPVMFVGCYVEFTPIVRVDSLLL